MRSLHTWAHKPRASLEGVQAPRVSAAGVPGGRVGAPLASPALQAAAGRRAQSACCRGTALQGHMAVCPWVVSHLTAGLCVQRCARVRDVSGNPTFTDRLPPQ